ncbi:MAG: YiiX/YebB-like N1pC/P60 family cysteine hydrolase [Candidatus Eremiobacteraeota bacterium]|nr:YiiX/YebB-like N1pC/P60 family cysteine hydrolase [Candidatus Eremiobacteraeota bacterium]
MPRKASDAAAKPEGQASVEDRVALGSTPDDCPRVTGTIGAAVGAITGRAALLPSLGVAGATALAASVIGLGPVGLIAAGVAGLGLGIYTEAKLKAGRVLGGMIGGTIGSALGHVAQKLGFTPSEKLAEETRGFSLKSLFSKLQNPEYTSHKLISSEEANEIAKNLQPGDLLLGNNDGNFGFEFTQKAIGGSGAWTHIGIVADDKTVMEVMIPTLNDRPHVVDDKSLADVFMAPDSHAGANANNKPYMERDPRVIIQRNHHVIILRPNYKDRETILNVIKTGKQHKNVEYDKFFNLSTDDKMYCTEFAYKVLHKAAPEISLEPSSFLGYRFITGDEFIDSPDIKPVFSTGSNFWHNYLSKFD